MAEAHKQKRTWVLVADNYPATCVSIGEILKDEFGDAVGVVCGENAPSSLALLREQHIDVLFADDESWSGKFNLVAEVRKDPRLHHVAIESINLPPKTEPRDRSKAQAVADPMAHIGRIHNILKSVMAAPHGYAQILVIEDHPLMLEGVMEELKSHGFRNVKGVASCEAALKVMTAETFDVIVTDTSIKGGMSGLDFTHIVRTNADIDPQPIIVGMSTDLLGPHYMEAKANDFWPKGDMNPGLAARVIRQLEALPKKPAPTEPTL